MSGDNKSNNGPELETGMETILRLINGVAWERVIMALLHSLWQGAILAVVVWAMLRGISASRARLRSGSG